MRSRSDQGLESSGNPADSRQRYNVAPNSAFLFALGTIAALYFLRDILIPLAFAWTLTLVLAPVVDLLQKHLRLPRVAAVLIPVFLSLMLAAFGALVVGSQLFAIASDVPTYRAHFRSKIERLKEGGALSRIATAVHEFNEEIDGAALPASSPDKAKAEGKDAAGKSDAPLKVQIQETGGLAYLSAFSARFISPVAEGSIIVVLAIFILIEREDLRNRILRLFGSAQLVSVTQAVDDATKRVSRYLLLLLLVNMALGAVVGVGLYLIGIPSAALWGAIAAILRFVPYVGALIAGAFPSLLALVIFDGWQQAVLVVLMFLAVELTTANLVEPLLYGKNTGVSSLALLVSAVFWTILWGAPGLVLATPLTVCLVVMGQYLPGLAFLHILLGDQPSVPMEAQLYQRLVAMDHNEAKVLVDQSLKTKSLLEFYNTILIPLLLMAEEDRHRGIIDPDREHFLFLSVHEMVSELSEHQSDLDIDAPFRLPLPQEGRVICLPARNESDAVSAGMLGQILERQGHAVISLAAGPDTIEICGMLDVGPNDILYISALAPHAFSSVRPLFQRLRSRFPKVPIVVGFLGFAGDIEKAKLRFGSLQPDYLIPSLPAAVKAIEQVSQARRTLQPESS